MTRQSEKQNKLSAITALLLVLAMVGILALQGFAVEDATVEDGAGLAATTVANGDTENKDDGEDGEAAAAAYTMSYDKIEEAVLAGSPVLKAADLEIEALKKNDAISDASDAMNSAAKQLNAMQGAIRSALEGLYAEIGRAHV